MSVPVILDTDQGVDDAVALMLAAASPEVKLLAITTVFGNVDVDLATTTALRMRELAGLSNVPVATGAARPLVHRRVPRTDSWHGPDGLGGSSDLLPEATGPVNSRGAVAVMADLLSAAPAPVTLVAVGPLTNVALALAAHPEIKPKISRVVAVGGSLRGAEAEFNIRSDPEAARRVLVEEDVPTTLLPLDVTLRATFDARWLYDLAAAGPRCATLAGVIEHCRGRRRTATGSDTVPLHDALAVLEAAVAGTLRTTTMHLDVVCNQGPDRGALLAEAPLGQDRFDDLEPGDPRLDDLEPSDPRLDHPGSPPADQDTRPVQVALDGDLEAIRTTMLDRLRSLH